MTYAIIYVLIHQIIFRFYHLKYSLFFKYSCTNIFHRCSIFIHSISSDDGLSRGPRQAIMWTNAGILLNGPLVTKNQWNLNRNSNNLNQGNAFANVYNMAAIFLGLNVLIYSTYVHKRIMTLSLKNEISCQKIIVSDLLVQKLYIIT